MKNTVLKLGIEIFSPDFHSFSPVCFVEGIRAGFPSPAQDYMDTVFDLNKELVHNPTSTFYGRVSGTSMVDAGIYDGDILVIDRSIEPANGLRAVCFVDGEFTIKTLKVTKTSVYLMPANAEFKPIKITEENNFMVWGVVTYVIHKCR